MTSLQTRQHHPRRACWKWSRPLLALGLKQPGCGMPGTQTLLVPVTLWPWGDNWLLFQRTRFDCCAIIAHVTLSTASMARKTVFEIEKPQLDNIMNNVKSEFWEQKHLPTYLLLCLYVCLSVTLLVCLFDHPSVFLSVCFSLSLANISPLFRRTSFPRGPVSNHRPAIRIYPEAKKHQHI